MASRWVFGQECLERLLLENYDGETSFTIDEFKANLNQAPYYLRPN